MNYANNFLTTLVGKVRARQKANALRRRIYRSEGICFHHHRTANIGDLKCAPKDYVPFLSEFDQMEIAEWRKEIALSHLNIIIGGGGLFSDEYFTTQLNKIVRSRPKHLICWGAGQNNHDSTAVRFPKILDEFDLVGVRDHNQKYEWVPCVSCLDQAFDRNYFIKHDVVLYNHWQFQSLVTKGFPELHNTESDFGKVIAFIASGETVLTTSYHGAYWATLLGRKVVVINPFSSKFFAFRHPPILTTEDDLEQAIMKARSYPGALEECRESNNRFAAKVSERIS